MKIILKLSYEKRAEFILKHYYGYKYEEIAEIIDCPIGTVRSRLHNTVKYIIKDIERKEIMKMKDSDKIKDSLIDEFYNEVQDKVDENTKYSDEVAEFRSKLNSTALKIDVLNEDIFDLHIDTLSIIEQGKHIRENRNAKKEFILFIL